MSKYSLRSINRHYFAHQKKYDNVEFDNLRGGNRIEILCAHALILMQEGCAQETENILIEKILNSSSKSSLSLEYGYSIVNENIGYPGLIPTCFQLYVLTRLLYDSPYKDSVYKAVIFDYIISKSDYLYSLEQNGKFPKAYINKSIVLNTNLFAAFVIGLIASKLDQQSNRRIMYEELVQRATKRVINRQEFNGAFPYHEDCFKYPLNYHSMVTGLLYAIGSLNGPNQSKIYCAANFGRSYFLKNINDTGIVKWGEIKKQDKHGASWTTGWLLHQLPTAFSNRYISIRSEIEESNLLGGDEQHPKNLPDIFFTSWFVIAEDISSRSPLPTSIAKFDLVYWWSIKLLRPIYWIVVFGKIILQRIRNICFKTGSLENRYWN
jgi:hypothetical protein